MSNDFRRKDIEGKKILVRQVGSKIGCTKEQIANIKGLGLRRIGSSAKLKATPEILGMIKRVTHLVKIEIL